MNRRAAAQRRGQQGYRAPADRPSQRRCSEQQGSRAVARAVMHGVEVRDQPDPDDGTVGFRAYASITEHPYDMWDMFGPYTETIAATAFDQTLAAQPDVAYLLNHGGMTLARTTSGTLTIGRDDTGLWYEPRLDPQNSDVRNILSGIRRGDLDESSFAFRITSGSWSPDWTAYRIEQLDLHRGDVSTVNYGANPETGAYAISLGLGAGGDVDVDALDDQQVLALSAALEQRHARRAASERAAHGTAATMSRAELATLAELAAPHPLAARIGG
jgi:HK97 family phage prohead protease